MTIESQSVVALTYDLYTTENGQETFVEKATEDAPLTFLYGVGMMLPKFEENLSGMAAGDTYDFQLLAADAYGELDPEAIGSLPLELFKDGGELPPIGTALPLQDNQGNQFQGRVTEVNELAVVVDLNHPMAGKDLHFIGTILNVRPATADELAHGHAHGIDGHSGH